MKYIRSLLTVLAIGAITIPTASARDSFSVGINVGGYGNDYYEPARHYVAPPVVYYSPPPAYYYEPVRSYYHAPAVSYRYYGGGHNDRGHGWGNRDRGHNDGRRGHGGGNRRGHH